MLVLRTVRLDEAHGRQVADPRCPPEVLLVLQVVATRLTLRVCGEVVDNALIPDGGIALGSKPANCSSIAGAQAGEPGDYISVGVTYAYQPIFLDFTVGRLFAPTITKTTYMRLL